MLPDDVIPVLQFSCAPASVNETSTLYNAKLFFFNFIYLRKSTSRQSSRWRGSTPGPWSRDLS